MEIWIRLAPLGPLNGQLKHTEGGLIATDTRGGGGTPSNALYGEAPPERGTFFRLQVYERVGISRAEVYERVGIGNLSFRYLIGP